MKLASKEAKINLKIIVSLHKSKSVTHYVGHSTFAEEAKFLPTLSKKTFI